MLECAIHPITYRTPLKNYFLYTLYSRLKQIKTLYYCTALCKIKTFFSGVPIEVGASPTSASLVLVR